MNVSFKLSELPALTAETFSAEIKRALDAGETVLAFFRLPDTRLCAVFGSIAGTPQKVFIAAAEVYDLSQDVVNHPALHRFIMELSGRENEQPFTPLKGEAAHEVAVGPVHAGVIEPGHFRFQCMGEDVYHLEISLGYQHRGAEMMLADANPIRRLAIAETVAGDTSIAAATACAEIHESLADATVSDDDAKLRELMLELERIANHVGDLGALAGDVAFLPTMSFCGRIRGEYLNMTAEICGNRFGRNAVDIGGMRVALPADRAEKIESWIARVKPELDNALKLMFEEPTVCDRLEGTGTVSKEVCREIGMVGMAARASLELKGDVLSRAIVRRTEIEESHAKVATLLKHFQGRSHRPGSVTVNGAGNHPDSLVIAVTNAWRGPLVHLAVTNGDGVAAYRVYDPSFHNWFGLAQALRGEQISNFPICNKSFNLSYCGTDR